MVATKGAMSGSAVQREAITPRLLASGAELPHDLYDEHGTLLARAGSQVTGELLIQLRRFHIVFYHKAAEKQRPEPASPSLPPRLGSPPLSRFELDKRVDAQTFDVPPVTHGRTLPRLSLCSLRDAIDEGGDEYRDATAEYEQMIADVMRGRSVDPRLAVSMVDRFRKLILSDAAVGLLVADLKSDPEDYLYHHGMNVSLITMSIASTCGFDEQAVLDAGVGALMGDVGMLRVPDQVRFAERPLTDAERQAVEHHPVHTVCALESMGRFSETAMLVAYQMHERCDGSGYPKRRLEKFIHPLARIAAVADTYAAMTCRRPHRPQRYLPYDSIVTVLRDRNRLCRHAVRAAVNCLSLFPVGSMVQLSDGSAARVLRSGVTDHTRPTVVPLNADGSEADVELDLGRQQSPFVTGVLNPNDETTHPVHRRASDFSGKAQR